MVDSLGTVKQQGFVVAEQMKQMKGKQQPASLPEGQQQVASHSTIGAAAGSKQPAVRPEEGKQQPASLPKRQQQVASHPTREAAAGN